MTDATPPQPERPHGFAGKLPWLALAAFALAADLWTKHVVFYPHVLDPRFDPDRGALISTVTSWWNIILAYNPGVTFGLGKEFAGWVLGLGTAVVIAVLVNTLRRTAPGERLRSFALSIIIGGALGNLYDRALRPVIEPDKNPGVRDFLDWYVPDGTALADWLRQQGVTTHWYTFNVADAFIVGGVVLLAWKILREKPPEERAVALSAEASA